MVGNLVVLVVVDVYNKGIWNYDIWKVLEYFLNIVCIFGNNEQGYMLDDFLKMLEYVYMDWCVSIMFCDMGREQEVVVFERKV